MMSEHLDLNDVSFKPALLKQAHRFSLTNGVLSQSEGADAPWSLALDSVEGAVFVQQTFQKQRFTRLDLTAAEVTRTLAISAPVQSWRQQRDVRSFLALASAVAGGLETAQPGFQIAMGEHGSARLIMFVIGVLTSLAAIFLFVLALVTGVSGDRLIAGGSVMVLMLIFGAVLLKAYWPWAKPRLVPAQGIAAMLAAWGKS